MGIAPHCSRSSGAGCSQGDINHVRASLQSARMCLLFYTFEQHCSLCLYVLNWPDGPAALCQIGQPIQCWDNIFPEILKKPNRRDNPWVNTLWHICKASHKVYLWRPCTGSSQVKNVVLPKLAWVQTTLCLCVRFLWLLGLNRWQKWSLQHLCLLPGTTDECCNAPESFLTRDQDHPLALKRIRYIAVIADVY